jgi:hypothetical protein
MEILIGTNSAIRHRVFWKGESAYADDLPEVRLYDITEAPEDNPAVTPGTLLSTGTAEQSETDIGVYNFYPDLEVTNSPKELMAEWSYEVDGSPVLKRHEVYVVVPYVDISQAVDTLGFGSDYNDPNHKTYQELLDAERYARKVIENYTQQKFYLYDDVNVVYGAGTDILPLPNKIKDIHEIYVNDILVVDNINNVNNWGIPVQVAESGFGVRVNRANMLDNSVYTANGMIPPTINDYSGVFNKNARYKISGKYGWHEVPDEIELATIELMRDYFSKDKVWRNKYIKSISTFDWKFDFNSTTFTGTGNNYVDQLLLPYVINKMVLI